MFRRRRRREKEIIFGFDSFLDLVANVVGIIIRLILVAWVGARVYTGLAIRHNEARQTTPPTAIAAGPELSTEKERAAIDAARRRLSEVRTALLDRIEREKQFRAQKQETVARLAVLKAEHEKLLAEAAALERRTRQRDQDHRTAALSVEEIRRRTEALAREMERLRKLPSLKKTLTYRTPVAQTLQSEELYFECQKGRVTFIEVDAMLREIRQDLQSKGELLRTRWDVVDETGPVGSFRLKYVIARQRGLLDSVAGSTIPDDRANFSYGLSSWEAVPVNPNRGETLEQAMSPDSLFRRIVDRLDPKQTAVTFWVYPDSFGLYRQLRDYCLKKDIVVAGRPLPVGVPIGSSRDGSASLGQ
jgi:hypothetical protein